jgi:hypothetical protein
VRGRRAGKGQRETLLLRFGVSLSEPQQCQVGKHFGEIKQGRECLFVQSQFFLFVQSFSHSVSFSRIHQLLLESGQQIQVSSWYEIWRWIHSSFPILWDELDRGSRKWHLTLPTSVSLKLFVPMFLTHIYSFLGLQFHYEMPLLVHEWNMWSPAGGCGNLKIWGLAGGSRSLGVCLWRLCLAPGPLLFSAFCAPWREEALPLHTPATMMLCPSTWGQVTMDWTLQNWEPR